MKAEYLFAPHTKTGKREHRAIVERALGRRLSYNECVHHINGNKLDNRLNNLEVVSRSQHSREHSRVYWSKKNKTERRLLTMKLVASSVAARQKPVACFTEDGIIVRRFSSIKDVTRSGFSPQHVCQCCKGERRTHKGYCWAYIR